MKKILIFMLLVVVIGLSGFFVIRFLFGGDEDAWICVDNQWVKHGNPSSPMPLTACNEN
jgi:hypothetical protein